jgi:hypothetical protein
MYIARPSYSLRRASISIQEPGVFSLSLSSHFLLTQRCASSAAQQSLCVERPSTQSRSMASLPRLPISANLFSLSPLSLSSMLGRHYHLRSHYLGCSWTYGENCNENLFVKHYAPACCRVSVASLSFRKRMKQRGEAVKARRRGK